MTNVWRRLSPLSVILLLAFSSPPQSIQLSSGAQAAAGMSAERLAQMDAIIQTAIEKKELPGAVVLVARHGKIVWRKAYGSRALEPQPEAMTTDTICDLA